MAKEVKRLFVGGLFPTVTEKDLLERFKNFGEVSDVEIKSKRDAEGEVLSTFAHLNINAAEKDLKKCRETYNKTKWKGNVLKIELAKESFIDKLKKERQESAKKSTCAVSQPSTNHDKIRNTSVTKALPGSDMEGMQNWVVGKYGRVLPVINLRTKDKKKVLKFDPSKYCHALKRINPTDTETAANQAISVNDLTWEIEEKASKNPVLGSNNSSPTSTKPKKSQGKLAQTFSKARPKVSSDSSDSEDSGECDTDDTDEIISKAKPKQMPVSVGNINKEEVSAVSSWLESESSSDEQPPVSIKPSKGTLKPNGITKSNNERTKQSPSKKVEETPSVEILNKSKDGSKISGKAKKATEKILPQNKKTKNKSSLSGSKSKLAQDDVVHFTDDDMDKGWESAGSADTGELINRSKLKPSNISQAASVLNQRTFADDTLGPLVKRGISESGVNSESESDADDIFDKLDSGQTDLLHKQAQSSEILADNNLQKTEKSGKKHSSDSSKNSGHSEKSGNLERGVTNEQTSKKRKKSMSDSITQNCKKESAQVSSWLESESSSEEEPPKKVHCKQSDDNLTEETQNVKQSRKEKSKSPTKLPRNKAATKPSSHDSIRQTSTEAKSKVVLTGTVNFDSAAQDSDQESTDSAATDELINRTKTKPINAAKNSKALTRQQPGTISEFSSILVKTGTTDDAAISDIYEGDSDAEDILDLIDSGKASLVHKRAQEEMENSAKRKKGGGVSTEVVTKKPDLLSKDNLAAAAEKQGGKSAMHVEPADKLAEKGKVKKSKLKGNSSLHSSNLSPSDPDSPKKGKPQECETLKAKIAQKAQSSAEKHELSNKQRLASLKQKEQALNAQKSLVKKALADVDTKSSKKIVFDSEDEDEQLTQPSKADDEDGSDGDDESGSTSEEEGPVDKSGKVGFELFQSSEEEGEGESGEDEEEQDQARFRIRPEFEGKAGQKLMKLQSRYGTDERFKLDAHFAESDSDSAGSGMEQEEEIAPEDGIESEKSKALEILKGVVGAQAVNRKSKVKAAKFKDMASLHYDPSREDHKRFEVQEDPDSPTKKSKKSKKLKKKEKLAQESEAENKAVEADPLPEVSREQFFEVKTSLKEVFEKKESGFSLLSMFGKAGEETENAGENCDQPPEQHTKVTSASVFPWQQENFTYDSSEDEELQLRAKMDTAEVDKQQDSASKDNIWNLKKETLFFHSEDDPRLKEGLEWSCRSEPPDVVKAEWLRKRPGLIDAWKNRRKRMLRRLKEGGQSMRGKPGTPRGGSRRGGRNTSFRSRPYRRR